MLLIDPVLDWGHADVTTGDRSPSSFPQPTAAAAFDQDGNGTLLPALYGLCFDGLQACIGFGFE